MSIKNKAIASLKIVALTSAAAQFLSWVITIRVIRILAPEDYALMSMSIVFLGLVMLANELGIIPAYIQHAAPSAHLTRQVLTIVLLSATSLYVLVFLAAPLVALFFGEPDLTLILRVIGLKLLLGAFGAVPIARLQRELNFRLVSLINVFSVACGSVSTLVLAYNGYGVWSLVFGNLVLVGVNSLSIVVATRFAVLPTLNLKGTASLMSFGLQVTGNRALFFARTQVDNLIVAKLLGSSQLGLYSVAFNLATTIMSKLMGFVNQVGFPAFSRLQDDRESVSRYFLRTGEVCAFIFFPIFWGLSSVASEFVSVLLGDKWMPAATALQIICLSVPFQALGFTMGPVLNGLGRPDIMIRNGLTSLVLLGGSSLLLVRFGIEGVATAVLVSSLIALVINFRRSAVEIRVEYRDYVDAVLRTIMVSAAMYAGVLLVREAMASTSDDLRLIAAIATGATLYTCGVLLIGRETALRLLRLIRR